MNMEKIFKQSVFIQIILFPILLLLEIFFPVPDEIYYLPYFDGVLSNISDFQEIIISIIVLALIVAYWISCFLIYFFNPTGRSIYVWMIVLATLSSLIGPVVYTALTSTLGAIHSMLIGATIVFMFFTPIKDKFNR